MNNFVFISRCIGRFKFFSNCFFIADKYNGRAICKFFHGGNCACNYCFWGKIATHYIESDSHR